MPKTKTRLTKQERYWIQQYEYARYKSIYDAYEKPSYKKVRIESDIKQKMYDMNGQDYRILSKNGFHFSCGFVVDDGDNQFLVVCTPTEWYHIVPIITVDSETGEVKEWISEYDSYWESRMKYGC